MRVLIDTNVLLSAAISSSGTPFKAFVKAVTAPNQGIICEQNVVELRRVFNRKFPGKTDALNAFLAMSLLAVKVIAVPNKPYADEEKVRDIADRPILRSAIFAEADIILTGDKDLLEAGIDRPLSVTPSQFLAM